MPANYTVPDSTTIREALETASMYRNLPRLNPPVAQLLAHVDLLVAELREITQAHAESIEAYGALRRRVRDAAEVDDYR